ncbi:PIN domain-containing protein [Paenibacillus sp. 1A_MP2]|uniref:PIN domain-containing protein n=1 Tax=Paenibacillus sp. 1A_MP2 TaxID=3457495 RepID=UPI003FCE870E
MSKTEIWMDTNIIIYVLRDNEQYSPQARKLVQEANEGKYTLKISPLIISECVFVLTGKFFGRSRVEVADVLSSFINLKGIECEEKDVIEESLRRFREKKIDFVDAYLAAHAKAVTPAHVVTVNVKDFLVEGLKAETPDEILKK